MKRRDLLNKLVGSVLLYFPLNSFGYANVIKEDTQMNIQLIITFKIKSKKLDSFLKLVEKIKKKLPQADGCLGVKVYQVNEDSNTITFIETWQSIEQHKKYIDYVIKSGDWDYISLHLEGSPVSHYYHKI